MNQGDIHYTFNNATDDADYGRCAGLDNILSSYKTGLVNIFGDESASSGETGSGSTGEGGETGGSGSGTGSGEGGSTGGSEGGSTVTPIEGTVVVTFTGSKPSSDIVTVSGNYSTSKGTATIDGTSYSTCVKMESETNISVTVDKKVTMTLYFSSADTKTNAKIDGKKPAEVNADINATAKTMTVTLEAGTHTITKQDACNLFGIKLVPVTE